MLRPAPITLIFLALLLALQGFVLSAEGPAYAEFDEDYVVTTSTSINDGEAVIQISVWTPKSHVLVNGTTVRGRPEYLDEDMLQVMFGESREAKAIRAAALEAAKWIRQHFPLPRVRVTAPSANSIKPTWHMTAGRAGFLTEQLQARLARARLWRLSRFSSRTLLRIFMSATAPMWRI